MYTLITIIRGKSHLKPTVVIKGIKMWYQVSSSTPSDQLHVYADTPLDILCIQLTNTRHFRFAQFPSNACKIRTNLSERNQYFALCL